MSGAQFYSRDSEQPDSRDLYLIYVAIAYFVHYGANEDGKKCLHSIMRYLLPAELMLTLLCSDVTLLMLVVRIIVLSCAFFNADFIPTLTLRLWTTVRSNAPVVWQWLRDNAPVVWQWLREQWSDVRQDLAQQWVATERGHREALVPGARSRSPSPHERASSQGVEQAIKTEPETVMQKIKQEPSAEQEGNSYQLVYVPSNEPQVPRVVASEVAYPVQAFQMPPPDWNFWWTNHKRKRDKGLPAEPESEPESESESERAAKIQRI
jgi:hypothetical protein